MKIAVAQINTTIGDFDGNAAKIVDRLRLAEKMGADIVVYPELSVCGYPPRDLLEKADFVRKNLKALENITKETRDTAAAVGYVSINEKEKGRALFNSAAILRRGRVEFVQHKTLLPEYDVFDEARHFEPAHRYGTCKVAGKKVGLSMCEDIWSTFEFRGRRIYRQDPIEKVVRAGAQIVLNLSASPYTIGKDAVRKNLVCGAARRFKRPIIYCNLIGGNDELVFDGKSFVANEKGEVVLQGRAFEEDFFTVDLEDMDRTAPADANFEEDEIISALSLGLSDYMKKCGFEKVVIGLSGGIDSALVAAIACRAIGADKVTGVLMPSPYSSEGSVLDARALAKNLGIATRKVPIGAIYEAYKKTLGIDPAGETVSLVEENIQARIRGNILMAISNRENTLVLSTGNKSELSVGYCTLYGDMAGGLALISDIPKMMVYGLSRHINKKREIIPDAILKKPPSAELKPDQTDRDSLPPYEELDAVIRMYVEDRMSVDEIIAAGLGKNIARRIVGMIDRNEYKRRQAAPGIKITSKAFGPGRRFPIAWKT